MLSFHQQPSGRLIDALCANCGRLALIPGSAGQMGPLLCLECSDHVQRLQRLREWGVIR